VQTPCSLPTCLPWIQHYIWGLKNRDLKKENGYADFGKGEQGWSSGALLPALPWQGPESTRPIVRTGMAAKCLTCTASTFLINTRNTRDASFAYNSNDLYNQPFFAFLCLQSFTFLAHSALQFKGPNFRRVDAKLLRAHQVGLQNQRRMHFGYVLQLKLQLNLDLRTPLFTYFQFMYFFFNILL
jgi:hypothetical protein